MGQSIISHINDTNTIIKSIKNTLVEEENYLNKRAKSLDTTCYEKLRGIVNGSKKQVGLLERQMQQNATKYTSDFSDKIDNPMICIETPYENIISSIIK
jgi:hypothetical protein